MSSAKNGKRVFRSRTPFVYGRSAVDPEVLEITILLIMKSCRVEEVKTLHTASNLYNYDSPSNLLMIRLHPSTYVPAARNPAYPFDNDV